MREIEIKARVDNREALTERLMQEGITLGKPLEQHDVVYLQPGIKSGDKDTMGLRIRTENGKTVRFTLKKIISGLDKIEHEVRVDDSKELASIIGLLGFELYSDLTKTRRKTKVGDIEICVDEVTGLGDFIEAEMLTEDTVDSSRIMAELWDLFLQLGVKKTDEVHEGYDILDRRQRGLPI